MRRQEEMRRGEDKIKRGKNKRREEDMIREENGNSR